MTEIKISPKVQDLLEDVNDHFPGEVRIHFGAEQSGYVRHDQAQQVSDGQKMLIEVSDITAPDYTASHELLHLLMVLKGFPQIYFQLTSDDAETDQQLMVLITELYDIVAHEVVVSEQRRQGLIDDNIEELFIKGIKDTITPENDGAVDGMSTLRLLMMMDTIVFFGDRISNVKSELEELYPTAFAAAQKIEDKLQQRDIKSPFDLRRKVLNAFRLFDEQMQAWNLPEIHAIDFVTLGSVFSERQLRLKVRQVFQIFHSDLHEQKTKTRAYVGIGISDKQNSFVLPTPKKVASDEYFRELYNKNVKELFDEMGMPYTVR